MQSSVSDDQTLRQLEGQLEGLMLRKEESTKRLWQAEGAVLKQSQVIHEQSRKIREAKEKGADYDMLETARGKLRQEKAQRENLRSKVAFERDMVLQFRTEVERGRDDVECQRLGLRSKQLEKELAHYEAAAERCRDMLSDVNERYNKAMRWEKVFLKPAVTKSVVLARICEDEDREDDEEKD